MINSQNINIAVFQMNSCVGDMAGNAKKIIEQSIAAKKQGADLLVTPEMSICGYPAEDFWCEPAFIIKTQEALIQVANNCAIPVLVGHPELVGTDVFNALSLVDAGGKVVTYYKKCLPNDAVFDELRYFSEGSNNCVFSFKGVQLGLLICADLWVAEPLQILIEKGAQIAIVVNASPFSHTKPELRNVIVHAANQPKKISVLYVNSVGGQDELLFDGGSYAINPTNININKGERPPLAKWQLPSFVEAMECVYWEQGAGFVNEMCPKDSDNSYINNLYQALILGLHDYLGKNDINKVLLGLSGGIDSAVALDICVQAIGANNVCAVTMPSTYTAEASLIDAKTIANKLGVTLKLLPIEPTYKALINTLTPAFDNTATDVTEENLQARIRGVLLMALSNKNGGIVINTSNKSEMATGYGTLYGDMVGGFAPLKDVYKNDVYKLAHHINRHDEIIPKRIITRAPSAELRPDQTDQDSLPAYDILDHILINHLEGGISLDDMLADINQFGGSEAIIRDVFHRLHMNEYKRRQAPIGTRVSDKAFGKDRRMPITHKFIG